LAFLGRYFARNLQWEGGVEISIDIGDEDQNIGFRFLDFAGRMETFS